MLSSPPIFLAPLTNGRTVAARLGPHGWAALLACAAAVTLPPSWVVLVVIAPLAEEVVFRRGFQELLLARAGTRRSAGVMANVVTALAFAAAHAATRDLASAALVALPALLLGAAYQRWRRLDICVGMHAAFNAVWLAA